jgi:hypothetical protein
MELILAYYIGELQTNEKLSETKKLEYESYLFRYFDITIKRKTNNWTFNDED